MAIVTTHSTGQPVVHLDGNFVGVMENYIDFAAYTATAADVIEVLNVDAGTFVFDTFTRVVTAEGATATGDLGDGSDPNGYNDAVNMNSTAGTIETTVIGVSSTDAYGVGRYYSSADTIDLTLDHSMDAAQMYVAALCFWPERMSS